MLNNETPKRLPSFFYNDEPNTRQDKGQETLQDFFICWTLHCAAEKYRAVDEKVQQNSSKIVFTLINGKNDAQSGIFYLDELLTDDFKVIDVSIRREYKQIDIVAEITTFENGKEMKYLLNIEDKYYTRIGHDQLEKAINNIKNEYNSKPEFTQRNLVIFSDDCIIKSDPTQLDKCKENGYTLLSIDSIHDCVDLVETDNALFDEFWFYSSSTSH
jgi:hypothetical protein